MMKNPLITVVTVVLNAEAYIEQTIKSVINQTYQNVEYIVLDGGSIDETLDIIKQYEDKITLWKSEPDKGIFDAMNKAIDLANGEFINFMNAGDFFCADNVLESMFQDKNAKEDFIYGGFVMNYRFGEYCYSKEVQPPEANDNIWKAYPCHQSSFISTELMKANKFNTNCLLEKPWGDFVKVLDFYYNKKISFGRRNVLVANYLGGGYTAGAKERPELNRLNMVFDKWRLTLGYVNKPKVHFEFFLSLLKMAIIIVVFRFLPDRIRYELVRKAG